MGDPAGIAHRRRVHRGRGKKLAALLRWSLEGAGDTAELIEELAEEEPDAARLLANLPKKPEEAFVPPGAEFAWGAFWRLHGDRQHVTAGFAAPMGATVIEPRPGRIPFRSIDAYARRYGVIGSEFDRWLALIEAVDKEYLAIETEKAEEREAQRRAG